MALLSINLLGRFQVMLEGQVLTGFSTDKTRALLAYLATEADRPHRRQALAGLLWPNYPERSARTSLRTALANLRQLLGDRRTNPPFLLISRQTIQINHDSDFWVDITILKRLYDTSRTTQPIISELEKAATLYQGSFLEGFSLADSAVFDDWVLIKREQLERQMRAVLHRLITGYSKLGNYQKALTFARRQVELDPWQEPAQRDLMRLLATTGRRAAALAQYEACRRILAEELGVEPELETIRLYEEIRDGKLQNAVVSSVSSLDIAPSPPPFLTEDANVEVEYPTFIGRQHELNVLHTHLQKATDGRGQVVFVIGGAGRGKTLLLEEFVRQILNKYSIIVASGYCNAYSGVGDPYLPFRQVLEMLTGDVEDKWAAGRITKEHATLLWEALPHTAQAIVKVGPDLIETFLTGRSLVERTAAAAGSDGDWLPKLSHLVNARTTSQDLTDLEQHSLIDQYVRVLEQIAQHRPLLIVLDDLQWADEGSINMLLHIGRRLTKSRIFILAAYRPEEMAESPKGDHHLIEEMVVELRGLHGENLVDLAIEDLVTSRQFVDELLDIEPNRLGKAFRQALHNRTGGHPLFTAEMLQMLQNDGDIIRDSEGRWVEGQQLAWNKLPVRVEAVIQKRVDKLDAKLLEILAVASVEGEEFTVEVVEWILDIPKRQLLRSLSQELGGRYRLLRERGELKIGDQHISRFSFSHHLIQRYVYKTLGNGERRLLHEEIAKALEDLFADDIEEVTIQLAYHFSQTGVVNKAVHYLTQAGHQAKAIYDGQQAIRYYTEALTLLPDNHPDQMDLLAARSAVFDILAERKAQKADIDAMEALAIRIGNRALQCDALLALTDFFLATEPFNAKKPAEQSLQIAQEINDGLREAHAFRRLAWARRLGTDFQTSLIYIKKAAERFTEETMPGEAADCLFMLARRLPGSGEHFFELEAAERAMALSQEANDYRLEAVAQKNLAIAYMNWERYSEALLLADEALAMQRDLGNRGEECYTLDVLGVVLARLGRQEDALTSLNHCLSLAEEIGSDWGVLGAVHGFWNYYYVPNGEYELFLAFIDERLSKAHTAGRDWLASFLNWLKMRILAELGQLDDALILAQREDYAVTLGDLVSYVFTLQDAGIVKTKLGHYVDARQDLEKALALAKRLADEYLISWPLTNLATLALIEGEQNMISKGLEQAGKAVEAARAVREVRQLAEALDVGARLNLALDMKEQSLNNSLEVMRLLEINPYLPSPHKYHHTHSLALRAIERDAEANDHLQRAYTRVMFVAAKLNDDTLRQSWLHNDRVNNEILEAWNELGPKI